MIRRFRRELSDEEFLEDIENGGFTNPKRRVLEDESQSISVTPRIVQIGKAAGDEASADIGIIRLPPPIVALANYGIGECIKEP